VLLIVIVRQVFFSRIFLRKTNVVLQFEESITYVYIQEFERFVLKSLNILTYFDASNYFQ